MNVAPINLPSTLELKIELTDEQFFQLCQNNRDLRFERTAKGDLLIMPPTGGETSNRNARLTRALDELGRYERTGDCF